MSQKEKFLSVIEKIASNPRGIIETHGDGNEYYFNYQGHAMSILKHVDPEKHGAYTVYFYPQWTQSVAGLSNVLDSGLFSDVAMIAYRSLDYGEESIFAALYQAVTERHYHLDDVFDSILG
jgi:hypothetical protein